MNTKELLINLTEELVNYNKPAYLNNIDNILVYPIIPHHINMKPIKSKLEEHFNNKDFVIMKHCFDFGENNIKLSNNEYLEYNQTRDILIKYSLNSIFNNLLIKFRNEEDMLLFKLLNK